MAQAKIPCGGFYYDDSRFIFKDKVLTSIPIPSKVGEWLYEVEYDDYDYSIGEEYYNKYKYEASCSVMRVGDLIGRNLDWNYTDGVEFIVRTKATKGKYATIGVAHSLLSEDDLMSNDFNERLLSLPFAVSDCMNTKGVYANMNVVNAGDKGYTTGTNKGKEDLCQLMIPRFVCDYASSADEAITLLQNRNIYAPLINMGEECHILLCDSQKTYVLEFINNEMKVVDLTDATPIMTNFYLSGWNGTIASKTLGNTDAEIKASGLTAHAMGLERYNILADAYEDIQGENDLVDAMASVKYTLTYNSDQNPYWYSEFVGGDLTIYSSTDDFADIKTKAIEYYNRHIRDGKTWYTAHTSVYDIDNKKLSVYVDEDYAEKYEFVLPIAGKLS